MLFRAGNTYRVQECTNSQSDAPSIEECQGTTIDNKTYFVYQNQCCSTTGEVVNYGTMYRISECYCRTDYCNGVTKLPTTTATPTTMNNLPSSYQPMGYSTATGQSMNNATPKDYSATPEDFEFVTTSRTVWQKNAGNKVSFRTTHWISLVLITLMSVIKLL